MNCQIIVYSKIKQVEEILKFNIYRLYPNSSISFRDDGGVNRLIRWYPEDFDEGLVHLACSRIDEDSILIGLYGEIQGIQFPGVTQEILEAMLNDFVIGLHLTPPASDPKSIFDRYRPQE